MLFYNGTLFEQAGLDPNDPPETWDEVLQYGQAIKEANPDVEALHVATTGASSGEWIAPVSYTHLHPVCAHVKRAELVYGPAEHGVAGAFVHGDGFAGHHSLIHRSDTREHPAVCGNGLAGQNPQDVAGLHGLRINGLLAAGSHAAGRAGGQPYQPFNACPGFGHGALFQQLSLIHISKTPWNARRRWPTARRTRQCWTMWRRQAW